MKKKHPAPTARKSRPNDQVHTAIQATDQARARFHGGAREVYERISEIKQAGFDTEQAIRELAAIHQTRIDELEAVGRTLAGGKPLHAALASALKQYRKDNRDLVHAMMSLAKADKARAALGPGKRPSELLSEHHEQRKAGADGGREGAKNKRTKNAPRNANVVAKWDEYDSKGVSERERIGKLEKIVWDLGSTKKKIPRSTITDILIKAGRYKPKKKK